MRTRPGPGKTEGSPAKPRAGGLAAEAATWEGEETGSGGQRGTLVWGGALGLGLLPVLAWNCLDAQATCGVVYPLSKNHLVVLAVAFFMVFGIMLQLYPHLSEAPWEVP